MPGILRGSLQALQQAGGKQTGCSNNETWPGFIVTGSGPGLLEFGPCYFILALFYLHLVIILL